MLAAPRYRGLDGREVRADMREVHLKVLQLLPICNGGKRATGLAGISKAWTVRSRQGRRHSMSEISISQRPGFATG